MSGSLLMAISLHTAGTWVAANATTQTVTLPTHSTGDMLILRVGFKHATMPTTVTVGTAGWTKLGETNGTGGASSNGGGGVQVAVFYKEATSASETNPVITFNGGAVAATPSAACCQVYQKAAGEVWGTPVGAGAAVAAATAISATIASHISATIGDLIDEFHVTNDNTTLTVPTFTQASLTLNTVVESPATALSSATSNDISADGCYRIASAGTSSAAAVITGTNSVADLGAAWTTRLRVGILGSFTADAVIKKTKTVGGPVWTTNPSPGAVRSTAYGNGYWVGVGAAGGALYYKATDPTGAWTSNTQGSSTFNDVAYGNGYWVAVGDTGTLRYKATNPTGAWTSNTQGSTNFLSVAYGNGYWVAVAPTGALYYKATDPTGAWTSNAQGSTTFRDVTYANGYWVAVGDTGALYYKATDPTGAWTSNAQGTGQWDAVAFNGGVWVIAASSSADAARYTSDPTGTWTQSVPLGGNSQVESGGGFFLAVSGQTEANNRVHLSRDGRDWSTYDASLISLGSGRKPAYDGSNYWTIPVGYSPVGVLYATSPWAELTADAVIAADSGTTVTGSFTADAVIKKTLTPTFTANAVIKKTGIAGSFTANAVLKKTATSSFTADAVVKKTITPTFTANAVIKKTPSGTATADAIRKRTFYFGSGPDPR